MQEHIHLLSARLSQDTHERLRLQSELARRTADLQFVRAELVRIRDTQNEHTEAQNAPESDTQGTSPSQLQSPRKRKNSREDISQDENFGAETQQKAWETHATETDVEFDQDGQINQDGTEGVQGGYKDETVEALEYKVNQLMNELENKETELEAIRALLRYSSRDSPVPADQLQTGMCKKMYTCIYVYMYGCMYV
jgi:hypothetical protein